MQEQLREQLGTTVGAALVAAFVASLLVLRNVQLGPDPTRIVISLVLMGGALAVALALRRDLVSAGYYLVVFFVPYLVLFGGAEVRASHVLLPFVVAAVLPFLPRLVPSRLLWQPLVALTLAYSVVIAASYLFNLSYGTEASSRQVALWLMGVGFFVVYAVYLSADAPDELLALSDKVFFVLVVGALMAVLLGLAEYLAPDAVRPLYAPGGRAETWGERGFLRDWLIDVRRVGSLVGAPNALGAVASLGGVVCVAQVAIRGRTGYLPFAVGIPILSLLLTTSRGAAMSFVAGAVVLLLLTRGPGSAVLLGLLGGGVALGFPLVAPLFLSGVEVSMPRAPEVLPAITERFLFWSEAARSLGGGSHALLGYGPSNRVLVSRIGVGSAHNVFVTSLHFYGLAGFLLLAGLVAALADLVRRLSRSRDPDTRFLGLTLAGIFVALLSHSMIDDLLFFNTFVMWLVFPVLAIAVNVKLAWEEVLEQPWRADGDPDLDPLPDPEAELGGLYAGAGEPPA